MNNILKGKIVSLEGKTANICTTAIPKEEHIVQGASWSYHWGIWRNPVSQTKSGQQGASVGKGICHQTWWPEFVLGAPQDRKRKLTPVACPVTSTCLSEICAATHIRAHRKFKKMNIKYHGIEFQRLMHLKITYSFIFVHRISSIECLLGTVTSWPWGAVVWKCELK